MKKILDQEIFNLSDKFILLYGMPLLLWPISFLDSFNFLEKICVTFLLIIMLVGIELLLRNHKHTYKRTFKRNLKAIDDLNVSFSLFITPQVFATSIFATIFGGIIGFSFISSDFFSFISIAAMFFIVILGLEFLFQDLILKPFMKENLVESSTSQIIEVDFIDYIKRFFPIVKTMYQHSTAILYGTFGFLLTFNFYYQDIFSLLLGTVVFIIIGFGLSSLKNSK
tara:strand:- start:1086 stop:1760 length:675 start_codon:yes stop_codon:yes gene_type:complete